MTVKVNVYLADFSRYATWPKTLHYFGKNYERRSHSKNSIVDISQIIVFRSMFFHYSVQ